MTQATTPYLLTASVARICKVAPATVRFWADTGRLHAIRTEDGVRLFARVDVEKLAREREEAAAVGAA